MAGKNDYTFEELDKLELMNITQAVAYVEFRIGMKRTSFYECIRPMLQPRPRAINFSRRRYAWLTVTKEEVDAAIQKVVEK